MLIEDKILYAPHERFYMELKPKRIKSISESGKDFTELPDPVRDPIVCNDISYSEFDYTYNCDEDI